MRGRGHRQLRGGRGRGRGRGRGNVAGGRGRGQPRQVKKSLLFFINRYNCISILSFLEEKERENLAIAYPRFRVPRRKSKPNQAKPSAKNHEDGEEE